VGVAVGLILAAFGAILTWAVNADVNGLNVTAVGVILMLVGILIVILDLLWWRSWTWYAAGPRSRRTYVRDTAAPAYPAGTVPPATGRRVVVDEEVGGPPGPPPP
jgi:hypothetical protein